MSEAWSSLTGATLPMPTSAIADAVAAVQVAAGVGDIDLDDASDEAVATLIANAWALSVERALETRPGCNAPRMDLVLRWHSLAVWAKNHGAKAVEAIAAYRAHLAEAAAAPPQRPRSQPAQPRPAEDPADLPTPEEISEMLAATRREIDNLDPFPARRFA